jgi:hypothetical protein
MKPTFTAEASIYRTTGCYRATPTAVHQSNSSTFPAILPSLETFTTTETRLNPAIRRGRRPFLGGRPWLLGGVGIVDGTESCFCGRVCDGNGENCTPCSCDPPGCGSC